MRPVRDQNELPCGQDAKIRYRNRIYSNYVDAGNLPDLDANDLKAREAFFRKLIREHFPPDRDAQIIDVGSGYGALLHFARQEGYRNISGIDLSNQQVALAKRLGIKGVMNGDLGEKLRDLPEESQDAVITIDVIEHFAKDEVVDLTDEIFRVLRTGGRWLVHVPNAESPFFGRIRYGDFTHELAFTRASLQQIAIASGFRSVKCWEDPPIPHGSRSFVRWVLWKLIRTVLRLYVMVETGDGSSSTILTQNLFASIEK